VTAPTITHNQGYLFDCETITDWGETEDGNTGSVTSDGNILDVNISASAGNKTYYWDNDNDIDISMTTYDLAVFRYKTSDSSIKAEIVLEFDDATTQTLLAETSSTTWTWGTAVPTTGKTLDHVRFHADQATGHVYYDFILFCKGQFTFPAVSMREHLLLPESGVNLKIPGRVGNLFQNLGPDSPVITLEGDMEQWQTWNVGGTPTYGEPFYYIWQDSRSEPFQWFTSDLINCKVCNPRMEIWKEAGSKTQRKFRIVFHKYSKTSGDDTDWGGLAWMGL
jgi:hypothetical protein